MTINSSSAQRQRTHRQHHSLRITSVSSGSAQRFQRLNRWSGQIQRNRACKDFMYTAELGSSSGVLEEQLQLIYRLLQLHLLAKYGTCTGVPH
jgi:hypothetical protein